MTNKNYDKLQKYSELKSSQKHATSKLKNVHFERKNQTGLKKKTIKTVKVLEKSFVLEVCLFARVVFVNRFKPFDFFPPRNEPASLVFLPLCNFPKNLKKKRSFLDFYSH